ncbi:MAG: L,D-transpeptidase/peptidoglycan binding protein [Lachnospiraceae bacterium]|nr:L,D-transpeptidase/peptidoglycan binding protein [Lachnospiraceae bacterium]
MSSNETTTDEQMKEIGKKNNTVKIVLLAVVAVAFVAYVATSVYYNLHFYPHTTIGDTDVSNKTVAQTEQRLSDEIAGYQLEIKERGNTEEVIKGEDIKIAPDFGTAIEDALKSQSGFAWPKYLFHKYEVNKTAVTYDEKALEEVLNHLYCTKDEQQTPSEDAYLEYEDGSYVIVSEVYGTTLKDDEFVKQVKEAVSEVQGELNLEKAHCYVEPTVLKDDEVLNKSMKKANEYVTAKITYDDGNNKLVCGADEINKMLTFDKEGNVSISSKKVAEFVKLVDAKYSTSWRARKFKTSYNKTITVTGGDYGWMVDSEAEAKAIKKAIKNQTVETREPIYNKKAASHGTYCYGNSYVEINITAQHLFVYENGKKVVSSDFVSGNISKGNGTRLGMFTLKYKEKNATLRGDDYETPVSYWMPFDGGIGMHDATWRSQFGGTIYKYAGSHGCVNLPLYIAKRIYGYIDAGDPIVVYELAGTESKTKTDKADNKEKTSSKKNN